MNKLLNKLDVGSRRKASSRSSSQQQISILLIIKAVCCSHGRMKPTSCDPLTLSLLSHIGPLVSLTVQIKDGPETVSPVTLSPSPINKGGRW